MEKTHWKKLDNPNYLGVYALKPGQDLVVQIASVNQEEIFNPNTHKKEVCIVAHFSNKDVKPMVLNVTNCNMISRIYGTPYIEDWVGKYISIYIKSGIQAFGGTVDGLRIRNRIPTTEKFYCEDCQKEIVGQSGRTAAELVEIAIRNAGRKLCVDCQRIEKARQQQASAKVEQP